MMDYTLFHIGAYITLSTLLLAILGLKGIRRHVTTIKPFLIITLLCFVAAGAGGGVVASNIPYFATFEKLNNTNIGPFFAVHAWPMHMWASLEPHIFGPHLLWPTDLQSPHQAVQ